MPNSSKGGADGSAGDHRSRRRAAIEPVAAVRGLTPYKATASQAAIEGRTRSRCFKLDWNESTAEPGPEVVDAISAWLDSGRGLNWYPRPGSSKLIECLEEYTGLSAEHLLVTAGSDAALRLVCSTFLAEGDRLVVPVPTYHHFLVFARSRGADVHTVTGPSVFDCDMARIDEAIGPNTRMVYLVSPTNPTGIVYDARKVARLCRRHPHTLVVVDEAYFEFCRTTAVDLVETWSNLVVTRTFSKAFGLAGLRVGYAVGSPGLVGQLRRLYNPKSVNAVAQVAAAAALANRSYMNSYVSQVTRSKTLLRRFFEGRQAELVPTPANFVVVRVGAVASTIRRLEHHGVYVRDRSAHPGLDGCLRMTVGTVEETRHLLDRIDDVFDRRPSG